MRAIHAMILLITLCALSFCKTPGGKHPDEAARAAEEARETVPVESTAGVADSALPPLFRDLLLSPEECKTPAAEQVSREQALEDLEVVRRVTERAHAGFEYLSGLGIDWNEIFSSARADLEEMEEPISTERFRDWLAERFSEIPDGHMAFWTVDPDTGSWQYRSVAVPARAHVTELSLETESLPSLVAEAGSLDHLRGAKLIGCEGEPEGLKPRPSLTIDELSLHWRQVVLSRDTPEAMSCSLRLPSGEELEEELAFRRLEVGEAPSRGVESAIEEGEVPVIRVGSFGQQLHGDLTAFVDDAEKIAGQPVVLVDLRGNTGGNDSYARAWFERLTNQSLDYFVIHELQSEVTLQGDLNWRRCSLASPDLDEKARANLEPELEAALANLESAAEAVGRPYQDWSEWTVATEPKRQEPFDGRLVLLVDNECASACESFVMYARQVPGTIVLGENTKGIGEFGEMRPYRLSHSGIWMQVGQKRFEPREGISMARTGEGYLPDVWLDDPSPLEIASRLASCLADSSCEVPGD